LKPLPSMRVLVIDDDPDLLLLCRLNFGHAGIHVIEARGGEEGLHTSLMEQPDVIVLDLMMPRVDGIEVLRRLKADPRTSTIPVVVITAKAFGDDQDLCRALGADLVMTKPLTMEELTNRVLEIAGARRFP
jgi:DNA-binding response OmpR family regulator